MNINIFQMKKILLFSGLFLILSFSNPLFAGNLEAEEYNRQGMDCLDAGNYDLALQKFNAAISIDPTYAEAVKNRGNAYYYKGLLEEALSDYLMAISIDPLYWNAYNNVGNVYSDMGKGQESLTYYNKAIELNPQAWQPYHNAGLVYLEFKDYKSAATSIQKAADLDPQNAVVQCDLGYSYYQLREVEKALEHLSISIELDPNASEPYFDLATIYFNRAVELNREFVDTESQEAMEGAPKLYQEALKNYQKSVDLEPDNPRYRYCLGLTYFGLTEDDKALEEYRVAMDDARAQGDEETIKLIQDQITKIQELKEKQNENQQNTGGDK